MQSTDLRERANWFLTLFVCLVILCLLKLTH